MYNNTMLSEILKLLPRNEIKKIVDQHKGDHYRKTFKTWDHLVAMITGQFSGVNPSLDRQTVRTSSTPFRKINARRKVLPHENYVRPPELSGQGIPFGFLEDPASIPSACVSDLPVRAVVVDAGGDVCRMPRGRIENGSRRGIDTGWGERLAGGFLFCDGNFRTRRRGIGGRPRGLCRHPASGAAHHRRELRSRVYLSACAIAVAGEDQRSIRRFKPYRVERIKLGVRLKTVRPNA